MSINPTTGKIIQDRVKDKINYQTSFTDFKIFYLYCKTFEKYGMLRESEIDNIHEMLVGQTYVPSPNRQRTIYDKSSHKERVITIPKYYPDQIIQRAIMNVVEPIFMRGMYRYCCGSIPNRGGSAVKKKVEKVLRKDEKVKYIFKADIQKFFPSISHEKVKEMLADKIKDKKVLDLFGKIIDNGGDGLPIGYYTSQWLSNFVLEYFDRFVKETLHAKYYFRYVDDIVIIDTNKRKLHKIRQQIEDFLAEGGYNLQIKPNWQVWEIDSRPLDFVGYQFYRKYTKLRKSIFYRLNKVAKEIKKFGLTAKMAMSFMSLMGWASHINFAHFYLSHIKSRKLSVGLARRCISEVSKEGERLDKYYCGKLSASV